jgi:hypothetical protein
VPEDLEQRLTHAEGRDSARLLLLLARPLCGSGFGGEKRNTNEKQKKKYIQKVPRYMLLHCC